MKEFKSLLTSVFIILLYVYATEGMVKWMWSTPSDKVMKSRVFILLTLIFMISLFFVIVSYHVVGPYNTGSIYAFITVVHIAYLILGSVTNTIIK